jgi:hypothetical protein
MIERYEQMLINYVWFIEIERVEGGAKLLRHYRVRFNSPERPVSIGAGHIIEKGEGDRTAIAVEIIPYGKTETERLDIVNPAHVFSYHGAEEG